MFLLGGHGRGGAGGGPPHQEAQGYQQHAEPCRSIEQVERGQEITLADHALRHGTGGQLIAKTELMHSRQRFLVSRCVLCTTSASWDWCSASRRSQKVVMSEV